MGKLSGTRGWAEHAVSPITYELDGRQFILTGAGGVLFAWAAAGKGTLNHERTRKK